jgi:hypothetical protein
MPFERSLPVDKQMYYYMDLSFTISEIGEFEYGRQHHSCGKTRITFSFMNET